MLKSGNATKDIRELLLEEIKREVFDMVDDLGLKKVEEVREFTIALFKSHEEIDRGNLLEGSKMLRDLRASYGN